MDGHRYGAKEGLPQSPRKPEGTQGARSYDLGIGMFVDERGSTTVATAVAILVSLVLVFGLANAEWTLSRAADVQSIADAGALAGMNAVAAYVTIAQILDAVVLSLGLIGMITFSIGLVLSALPLVSAAGPPVLSAAQHVFGARQKLATTAAYGLQKLEGVLPFLVAANSLAVVRSNANRDGSYVGVALPFPLEGASDFGLLTTDNAANNVGKIKEQGDEIDSLMAQAAAYQKAAEEALEQGWRSDCGDNPSMRERAEVLAGLTGSHNPHYPASTGWNFGVPIIRARAYYQQRLAQEAPSNASVEETTRSAARRAFYAYALAEMQASSYLEFEDGTVTCDLRRLPANTADVRTTALYTDPLWPCTQEEAGRVIHAYAACPGAQGTPAGRASVAEEESGACLECGVCRFTVVDLGRTPAASTSVDNGFEHHWRAVAEAAASYEEFRREQASHEEAARSASEQATDLFAEVLGRLGAVRVGLAPPGRYGCVCVVAEPSVRSGPEGISRVVSPGARLPARVALSAAVLAPDAATSTNNILADFFDGLVGQTGLAGGVSSVLDAVMSAWGGLLVSYGDGYRAFTETVRSSFKGLANMGLGRVSTWLKGAIESVVNLTDIQPADLSAKKPVLVNTADVMLKAGNDWYGTARNMVLAIQQADTNGGVAGVLATLGIVVEALTGSDKLLVAELGIPGTDLSIPIEIDFGWLTQVVGGGP